MAPGTSREDDLPSNHNARMQQAAPQLPKQRAGSLCLLSSALSESRLSKQERNCITSVQNRGEPETGVGGNSNRLSSPGKRLQWCTECSVMSQVAVGLSSNLENDSPETVVTTCYLGCKVKHSKCENARAEAAPTHQHFPLTGCSQCTSNTIIHFPRPPVSSSVGWDGFPLFV